MKRLRWPTALILLSLLTACVNSDTADRLDSQVQQGVNRGYPGFAVASVDADGHLLRSAAGFANLEDGIPLRWDQQFHIGSITKSVTAVLALQLVDQGKLSLDAKLDELLGPSVANIPYADEITVAQLIDHSSGIYATNNDLDYISTLLGDKADATRIFSSTELIALAHRDRQLPTGRPGEGHAYSDSNYTLLGLIIAKVSGMPFKEFARISLFEPLAMDETYFYSDEVSEVRPANRDMVRGYLVETEEIRGILRINPMFRYVEGHDRPEGRLRNTTLASERIDSAGGIISNLPDLLKFGSAMFGGKLLSPSSQSFLTASGEQIAQQAVGSRLTRASQAARMPYGTLIYKQGDGPGGTTAALAYLPDHDLLFAGFTNSFGYFDEVDFMFESVIPAILAGSTG